MKRKILESYQSNKRLVERNKEKIETEGLDIPAAMGKVRCCTEGWLYPWESITNYFKIFERLTKLTQLTK